MRASDDAFPFFVNKLRQIKVTVVPQVSIAMLMPVWSLLICVFQLFY